MRGNLPNLLFPALTLDHDVVQDLRRMNPWWEGKPMRVLPATRRHLVEMTRRRLRQKLAPIVVVRGPRQVGKTISQLQIIGDLLGEGVPPRRICRVQWDELAKIKALKEPVLRVVDWFEHAVLGCTLNEAAHRQEGTYLFFDEVQNLPGWETQLKALVDSSTTQMVVTGSSALRIEMGRDSLSGRISTLEAGVLSLTEIAGFHGIDLGSPFLADNGLEPFLRRDFWLDLAAHGRSQARLRDESFRWFSERGGYPLAHERPDIAWPQIADQLNENVIKRVIQHDLRVGEKGRKRDAALLEEVFRLACRYVGQSPGSDLFAREARRALNANVGVQRITSYLRFLDNTLLLRVIAPLEIRLKRRKGNAKLCLADHALRASWLQEIVPLDPDELAKQPHLSDLAGRIAESAAGSVLGTIHGLDIAHLPASKDQPEVDFVITIGTRRIPVEIKYQRRVDNLRDTEGLRTFLERSVNNAPLGILISQTDGAVVADPRIVCLPLSSFMLLR